VVRDTAADPRGPRRPWTNWLAWAWPPWRGSITASSLAPLPPGPTPSACRSSARRRFSTRSPNSRRMGRAPRPAAVPRLADLRGLPPRRGPQPNRRGGPAECLLGSRDPHSAGPPRSTRRHRHRTRHERARPPRPCATNSSQSRDSPPASGRPPGTGRVDRQVRPPRPAPRRDHDRCSGRATGVRRMGDVAGRRRRRDPVPALPARAPQPTRCTSRDGPPRAAGRSALLRRLRGLRHGRRPRRCAAFQRTRTGRALPNPGRASRSKAPAGRSGSPARRASASGNGPGRRSRSSTEIRRNPIAFGSFTPAEGVSAIGPLGATRVRQGWMHPAR
jgi:hypothetical protein